MTLSFGEYVIQFRGGPLDGETIVGLYPGQVIKVDEGVLYKNSGKVMKIPPGYAMIGPIHRYDFVADEWGA